MFFINTLAIILSISTGLMLIYCLVRVVKVLRNVAANLANVRLLLLTVAAQTQPVAGYVDGIQNNVNTLDQSVTDLGLKVGLTQGGVR